MTFMEQQDFEISLNNYRNGVQKVIPAYLTGKLADEEAWADELALTLHSRDELEWAFAASPALWQAFRTQVDELDRLLLAMKEAILARLPAYATFRQQFPRPRSHWWYYLDEIVSLPAHPTELGERTISPQGYWMPVVPFKTVA
jgi:hypothetical protein